MKLQDTRLTESRQSHRLKQFLSATTSLLTCRQLTTSLRKQNTKFAEKRAKTKATFVSQWRQMTFRCLSGSDTKTHKLAALIQQLRARKDLIISLRRSFLLVWHAFQALIVIIMGRKDRKRAKATEETWMGSWWIKTLSTFLNISRRTAQRITLC